MNPSIATGFVRTLLSLALLSVTTNAFALLPFEKTGNLYVSMWTADEIAVFSPDGTPVERFTTDGLDGPRGIAFNPANGEIWVAGEFSNAIYIFNHQHQLLRTLEHEDFNEPVGVTFRTADASAADALAYISNSNGNEIMVFNQAGDLQRRFTAPDLIDPNCTAFLPDGSLFIANRLGGSNGATGAVSIVDSQEISQFDFTTPGISSLMAIARDPNVQSMDADDTLWVTSGAGDTGIHEFDRNGNLLNTLLPATIDDGSNIVPQGIAFDANGDFYVVSMLNEILKFDSSGNFIMRFPTGSGTARSTAFQGCQPDTADQCIPLGIDPADTNSTDTTDTDANTTNSQTAPSDSGGSSGLSIILLALLSVYRYKTNRRPVDST